LSIGVPYEVFWHLTPRKLDSFIKAHRLRRRMHDEEAWLDNAYTLRAFEVVMAHFGAGLSGKRSSAKYFDKPMFGELREQKALTEEEKQREVDLFFAREGARRVNWNRNKVRKEVEENG